MVSRRVFILSSLLLLAPFFIAFFLEVAFLEHSADFGTIPSSPSVAESTKPISSLALLTETGLLASHLPNRPAGPTAKPSPSAFNDSQPPLKLGIPLLSEKLAEEVKKVIKAEDASNAPPPAAVVPSPPGPDGAPSAVPSADGTAAASSSIATAMDVDPSAAASVSAPSATTVAGGEGSASTSSATPAVPPPSNLPPPPPPLGLDVPLSDPTLLMPSDSDLIPLPQNFRTFDVKREVS